MNTWEIRSILDEIDSLTKEINAGSKAWDDGTDPSAMAECDPSDQYCKGEEIEKLKEELKKLVNEG